MKTNKQLLIVALAGGLALLNGLTPALARVTSDSVTFDKPKVVKPPVKKPAEKKPEAAKPEAKEKVPDHDYDHCVALVAEDAEAGLSYARNWQIGLPDGSLAARHCEALALTALGRHHEAAVALSEVALTMDDPSRNIPRDARAQAYAQAADAWSLAGDYPKALTAINQALALDAEADYLMTRANIHALAKEWDDVRIDTGNILAELPTDADALALRATAYRNLGAVDAALADASRAVEIAPHHLSALLERGRDRAAKHDLAGARTDWEQVVAFAKKTGQEDDPRAVAAQAFLNMGDGVK